MPKYSCSATWEEVGWCEEDTGAVWEMKIKQFIRREMFDHTQDDIMRAIMRGSRGTANPSVVRQLLKEQFAVKEEKSNA